MVPTACLGYRAVSYTHLDVYKRQIYYTLVNIGGALGPFLAGWVHKHLSVEKVFGMAAVAVFAMFIAVLLLFKEPRRTGEVQTESLGQVSRNFLAVTSNWRFMLFLIIFSGYYIAFWQEFIILPIYIHDFVNANSNTEALLSWDSLTVIALQMVVSILTQKMPAFRGITLGTLISGLAWILLIAVSYTHLSSFCEGGRSLKSRKVIHDLLGDVTRRSGRVRSSVDAKWPFRESAP